MPLMDIKTLGTPLVRSDFTRQTGVSRVKRDNERAAKESSDELRVSLISRKHMARLSGGNKSTLQRLMKMEGA